MSAIIILPRNPLHTTWINETLPI